LAVPRLVWLVGFLVSFVSFYFEQYVKGLCQDLTKTLGISIPLQMSKSKESLKLPIGVLE